MAPKAQARMRSLISQVIEGELLEELKRLKWQAETEDFNVA